MLSSGVGASDEENKYYNGVVGNRGPRSLGFCLGML